jgi:hypothetical protein
MKIDPTIKCAFTSLIGNFTAVLAPYYLLHDTHAFNVVVMAIFIAGFVVALIHGWIFGRGNVLIIGVTALTVILFLYIPVVLTTYGFALLSAHYLLAYALLALIGARLGAQASRCRSTNAG